MRRAELVYRVLPPLGLNCYEREPMSRVRIPVLNMTRLIEEPQYEEIWQELGPSW